MIGECLIGLLEISRRRRCGANQLPPHGPTGIIRVMAPTEVENARGPLERTFLKLLGPLPKRGLSLLGHDTKKACEMPREFPNDRRDQQSEVRSNEQLCRRPTWQELPHLLEP
jgi:hypothetical protein